MKKLIVLSVVLALVAGSVFAVDVTGTVFGRVNVLEGSTEKDSKVTAGGNMERIRLDGAASNDEGTFGGYIRAQGGSFEIDTANAWWKPIDQFKLFIGNNSDGQWGKEGVTGWMFNQMPNDSGVATNYGIWFGNGWGSSIYTGGAPMHNRYTFFEGFVDWGAFMEITPVDMVGINIAIPFMNGGEAKDVYKALIGQVNLNLDFGNIAITYDGGGRAATINGAGGALFVYFGGNFGDLGLDVGFSYHLTDSDVADVKHPIGIGAGVKYATDSFGVKFRVTAALAGDDKNTYINASVLPYFTLSDSMSVFVNAGLGMTMDDAADETYVGWYFNPYLRVGAEWGPTFYAGIQVSSNGVEDANGDKVIKWAVPIALMVSF